MYGYLKSYRNVLTPACCHTCLSSTARTDYDNLSLLSQDLRDRYELFSGHDELGDKFRNIQLQDRDSLDGQCSSEFVACTPEPTQLVQGSVGDFVFSVLCFLCAVYFNKMSRETTQNCHSNLTTLVQIYRVVSPHWL